LFPKLQLRRQEAANLTQRRKAAKVEKKRIRDSQLFELLFLRAFASLREAIPALF